VPFFRVKLGQIRRSVTDFEFFQRHLVRSFPYIIVPPVPETKGRVREYLAAEEYPQKLCRQFQTFLLRVGRHSELAKSDQLKQFLSLPHEDWLKIKSGKHDYPESQSNSWVSKTPTLQIPKLQDIYTEIVGYKEFMKVLCAEAIALQTAYSNLSTQYQKWNAQLSKMSALPSLNTGDKLVLQPLKSFNETFVMVSANATLQATTVDILLSEKITSWVDYARAAQQLLERYCQIEANYQEASASFQRRKQRLVAVQAQGNSSSSDGQNAMKQLQEAEVRLSKETVYYNRIQLSLSDELNHYDRMKACEINHWIRYYAERQEKNHSEGYTAWTKIAAALEQYR